MYLSQVFEAVACKVLRAVDLPQGSSNQHELNGVAALKSFFATDERVQGNVEWRYFADDAEPLRALGQFTFYDARERSAARTGRSEWRFYYYGSFLACATAGDLLALVKVRTGQLFALVFQKGSAWERAARVGLGLRASGGPFAAIDRDLLAADEIELTRTQILAELGLEDAIPVLPSDEELVRETFHKEFPTTREMSAFARHHASTQSDIPDVLLSAWLHREEQLFRALEKTIISGRLQQGFKNVDEFLQYSLSVQNRRKSRMGLALQNHLEELFVRHRLKYEAQAVTEAHIKADFIFPGAEQYHDAAYDHTRLVMLGAKSSSKDRWRQVLSEADRIPAKHLCTLEAAISEVQTDEMKRRQLTLVVPESLHRTYTRPQQREMMTVGGFIDFVRRKQHVLQ